jgi:hypothetical protein
MNVEQLDGDRQRVLCAGGCGQEHGCGVLVHTSQIADGSWERDVLLAHWFVLTLGPHEHKQVFCSLQCLSDWSIDQLLFGPGFAPMGVEPTNPAPVPEQHN